MGAIRPAAGAKTIAAKAFLTAAQAVANGVSTYISLTSESYDDGGMHDNATNPTRLTVPPGQDGVWALTASVGWAAGSSTGIRAMSIQKNGVAILDTATNPMGAQDFRQHLSVQDRAVAGDFYELNVFQNSGGDLNVIEGAAKTVLMAARIGA